MSTAPQVVSAIFGVLKGLVWLNLGVVANFQELRQNFHKGPHQWWRCCISGEGERNITRYFDGWKPSTQIVQLHLAAAGVVRLSAALIDESMQGTIL